MPTLPTHTWRDFFDGGVETIPLAFRVLKRSGADFLILPENSRCAARAIMLYPAQTRIARIAKSILRIALRCHVPLPLEAARIRIKPGSPFHEFLQRLAGTGDFPRLAILCGNPRTRGQRFIVLIFDGKGQPLKIVKAGLDYEARELIEKEITFLKAAPAGTPAIPNLRDELDTRGIRAMALDFVRGDSPRDSHPRASLLTSWLHKSPAIPITSLPIWKQTALSCVSPVFVKTSARIAVQPAYAAIYHGDFTPWNIKVAHDGTWTVLDWERGQIEGPPGWDWFHYVIQTGILVERLSITRLVDRIKDMLSSSKFLEYAAEAQIALITQELLLGYLFYCVEILKPADSLPATRNLLEALQSEIK